jgi:hypothetical protein
MPEELYTLFAYELIEQRGVGSVEMLHSIERFREMFARPTQNGVEL